MSRPFEAFSAAITASISFSEPTSGFSQMTCLPAFRAAMICSKCRPGGVQMSTMSTVGSASTWSKEVVRPRNAVGVADLGKAGFVQVADEGDVEQLLLLRIGFLDMGLANSEPDDGDVFHGHGAVLSVPGRWGRPSRPWPAP